MTSKLVVITGASSGIGATTAEAYAAPGTRLVLLARNRERLEAVAAGARAKGAETVVVVADLADPAAIEAAAATILADGPPDILINNAGAGRWLPLIETNPEEAQNMMAVPYFAAFNLTRALLPAMLARRRGQIGFVTSPASYFAWPHASAYIAARAAVRGLAEALQSELTGTGIAVTLIVLGPVESPYWEHNPGSRAHLIGADPRFLPVLSLEQAAAAIKTALDARKRRAVAPPALKALFLLNALFPTQFARRIRKLASRTPC
jgi:uncharacterized protein